MKINEMFESIQGEGRYAGNPALFIRLSNCNLNCYFCDTEFVSGKTYLLGDLSKRINTSREQIIIWTGGEPTLQLEDILKVIKNTSGKSHHLESNGLVLDERLNVFDYLCFSPKNLKDAQRVKAYGKGDIKIVTDLEINRELIPYATMLMPITTFTEKDQGIKRKVWDYCVKNNLRYSSRLHIDLWGNRCGR